MSKLAATESISKYAMRNCLFVAELSPVTFFPPDALPFLELKCITNKNPATRLSITFQISNPFFIQSVLANLNMNRRANIRIQFTLGNP
jgi:hypothetical protein